MERVESLNNCFMKFNSTENRSTNQSIFPMLSRVHRESGRHWRKAKDCGGLYRNHSRPTTDSKCHIAYYTFSLFIRIYMEWDKKKPDSAYRI